jgi:Lsr2
MAQRTQIVFTDDIDGSDAETTIRFAAGGTEYEIDLNAAHAAEFRQAVRPYVDAARKAARGSPRQPGRSPSRAAGPDPSQVRAWARGQGLKVSDRGRVPDELIVRFRAAGE